VAARQFISEQLLLAEYGLPFPTFCRFSTINGARALGLDNWYGAMKKERKQISLFGTKVLLTIIKIFGEVRQLSKMALFF